MLHSELISLLHRRFEQARDSGDLLFYPSTISEHIETGVKFQITLCPALQKKPQPTAQDFPADISVNTADPAVSDKKKVPDPFAPPYNPRLHLGDLKDTEAEYVLLLNKFSVTPEHFLLVTKEYQSQSSPLLPSELVQVYQLLIAAGKAGRNFAAFYNCGTNSGASQPHKHVQLIPVAEGGPPVEALARRAVLEVPGKPFSLTSLPYANHIYRFPERLSSLSAETLEETLSSTFLALLDLVVSTIRHDTNYPPGRPSFNILMTLEHMHLVPRREESYILSATGTRLAVNSLGYAGMLLVRSEEELDAVLKEGIGKILRALGVESVDGEQVADN